MQMSPYSIRYRLIVPAWRSRAVFFVRLAVGLIFVTQGVLMSKTTKPSCADCGTVNCANRQSIFPSFCLTEASDPQEMESAVGCYRGNDDDGRIARAAAEVEGKYYGKLTRVEEIMAFANLIGARTIGIATCAGLMAETRVFAKVLRLHGFQPYAAVCKVGAIDKTEIGLPEELKVVPGGHESICNPIYQAKALNAQKTELNVMVGLCVGHDSLFSKYSDAPVTTLIAKDRVLAHNPAAALYTSSSYYKRLFNPERVS
jgi:uncharacterized metal-binding protein